MEAGKGNQNGSRKQESSHAYRAAPIAALFEDCLQYFERLCSTVETDQEVEIIRHPMIEGCFSRFRQWGNDMGASKRLLDHALRKAPQLQQATKELLSDLLLALQRSKVIAFSPLLG